MIKRIKRNILLISILPLYDRTKMIESCIDIQNGTSKTIYCDLFPILDHTLSVLTLLFVLFGLVGNVLLYQTYRKKDLSIRFNLLMLTLAIYDFLFLIPRAVDQIIQLANVDAMPDYGKFLLNVFFNCGVYTSIFISLERFLLLCYEK